MRLSIETLKASVKEYVKTNNISNNTYAETRDNIVGMLDKIGKQFTLTNQIYDKLPELDSGELALGKDIEEWQSDMTLPVDYDVDADGNKALKDYSPTYRKPTYSKTLGRKILPVSIPYGNIERACNDQEAFASVTADIYKKFEDALTMYKYGVKRQLIGELCSRTALTGATELAGSITSGEFYKNATGTIKAVAMKDETLTSETLEQLITSGKAVELHLREELAAPVDEATSNAFIKRVKELVEIASDVSEGYSFNGNVVGASEGLTLYVKQGIMPTLEVETIAGAFNKEAVALPVTVKVIKDFGDNTDCYAVLVDSRILKLFKGYDVVRSNENGFGDRQNLFRHVEFTAHISKNGFVHAFVIPA